MRTLIDERSKSYYSLREKRRKAGKPDDDDFAMNDYESSVNVANRWEPG